MNRKHMLHKKKVDRARAKFYDARDKLGDVIRECPHDAQEEEPISYGRHMVAIFPVNPRCWICETTLDLEHYCHESPIKMCQFIIGGDKTKIYKGEDMLDVDRSVDPDTVECIHCGEPWERWI